MELSSDMSSFSLKLSMPQNDIEFVERCMSFAVRHKVKEIKLDFTNGDLNEDDSDFDDDHSALFELPTNMNALNWLECMELCGCRFPKDGFPNLHALKQVSLGWMEVTMHDIMALLSGCKMLESLSMKRCWNEDGFYAGEKEMGLRKLVLDKCHFDFEFVHVCAPCLTFFKYSGKLALFTLEVSSLLEEVELDFSPEYEYSEGHGKALYKMLEKFSSLRVLTVCSYLLQAIPSGKEKLRIQRDMNVRHLRLKSSLHNDDLFGIAFMLHSCPKLKRLTIQLGLRKILLQYVPPFNNVSHEKFWTDTVSRYRCLRSSLKQVEVKGFKGSANEVKVLTHLIAHGKVLKKMTINVLKVDDPRDWNYQHYRYRKAQALLEVPKASNDLEILVI